LPSVRGDFLKKLSRFDEARASSSALHHSRATPASASLLLDRAELPSRLSAAAATLTKAARLALAALQASRLRLSHSETIHV